MSGAVMTTVAWMLRASVAATFAGHGALAFGVNDKWLKYMSVAGFDISTSRQLMPIIGVVDMVVAALAMWPSVDPALFAWAALWGIATALMRPLAGEGILEFVERAGNWVPAACLLVLTTAGQSVPFWATPAVAAAGAHAYIRTSLDAHIAGAAVVFAAGAVFCLVQRSMWGGKLHLS